MDQTPNLNLPIPNADAIPPTKISDEFPRLALALTMLDEIIHTLQGVVAGKAEEDHTQAISTILGLTEALASKMPASAIFTLDSLADVQGAADALVNYVLVKNAEDKWVPSSALAALGEHGHLISEISGLVDVLAEKADAVATANALDNCVRFDAPQALTEPQQTQARDNIGFTPALVAYNRWKTLVDQDFGGVGQLIRTNYAAYRALKFEGEFRATTVSQDLLVQLSANNGATWISGASDYYGHIIRSVGGTLSSPTFSASGMFLCVQVGAGQNSEFEHLLGSFNKSLIKTAVGKHMYVNATPANGLDVIGHRLVGAPLQTPCNAIRIFPSTGSALNGHIHIEGLPG